MTPTQVSQKLIDKVRTLHHLPSGPEMRAEREALGISQEDVARELNITPATVSHWELGRTRPRHGVARRYAELLRILKEEAEAS